MSSPYGRIQILVCPPGFRFTQKSMISQFNTGGHDRGGCRRCRVHIVRGYGRGRGCGHGGRGECGGSSYFHHPYEFSSGYITLSAWAHVYPANKWRLLSSQQRNNIQ